MLDHRPQGGNLLDGDQEILHCDGIKIRWYRLVAVNGTVTIDILEGWDMLIIQPTRLDKQVTDRNLQRGGKLLEATASGQDDAIMFEARNLGLAHSLADTFGKLLLRQTQILASLANEVTKVD